MTADPRDTVSEFTEMTDGELAQMTGAFFRAIGLGAVAGGGLFLLVTMPAGLMMIMSDGEPAGLLVSVLPLIVALFGTLAGMICLGLPLTGLLRYLGQERAAIYTTVGLVGGFLLPGLISAMFDAGDYSATIAFAVFVGLFGAIAGSVTANTWGTYRESVANRDPDEPDLSTNPFHEMIY